jgi:hypothetical protein
MLRAEPPGPSTAAVQSIALEAWQRRSGSIVDDVIGWPLKGSIPSMSAIAASRFMVSALRDRVLWWSPADEAGMDGALLLAPYPFSSRLLGTLIGTG